MSTWQWRRDSRGHLWWRIPPKNKTIQTPATEAALCSLSRASATWLMAFILHIIHTAEPVPEWKGGLHAGRPVVGPCCDRRYGVPGLQVRLRCQKGIPPALRGRAWLYLCGGKVKREQNQGKFQVGPLPLTPPAVFMLFVEWIESCNDLVINRWVDPQKMKWISFFIIWFIYQLFILHK